ncbi:MAG: hypothetical protein AAGH88_10515 [Planctomycetota bacterium]
MPAAASRTILFTVFEPSGDTLAARLIRELKERDATLMFTGFGGPKMAEAGADLIQDTTDHASIGVSQGIVSEIAGHRARIRLLSQWLQHNDILAHVPVDSPAANWALCKQVRRHRPGARIVHLVCPQIWSWASWRIHRLRRLTDHVLCLLPFEPGWLRERGVKGDFVGHPLFEESAKVLAEPIDAGLPSVGTDGIRLALMPGSRPGELRLNWETMLRVYLEAERRVPGLVGVVAARKAEDRAVLERIAEQSGLAWPDSLTVEPGRSTEVMHWSDVVLVKSGTSTLQVASMGKPMVAFYNLERWKWHGVARWLIHSRTFVLPNIISEWQGAGRVVTEFVPHFGDPEPIGEALLPLLSDSSARKAQVDGLKRVAGAFAGVDFAQAAADTFLQALRA